MIGSIENLKPGKVVLLKGVPHLVEAVKINVCVSLQRIEKCVPRLGETHNPVLCQIEAELGSPEFDDLILLVPETDDGN